jgi:hypothetical protein
VSRRTAMAEPLTSLNMWKGSIILSFVLLNISVRLYTISRRKGSLLLLFDQSYEKGNRIQDKKASSSQPKSHSAYCKFSGGWW